MNPKEVYNDVKRTGKNWWLYLLLGIAAIAIGIWMLCYRVAAAALVTYVFAAYFMISGLIDLVQVLSNRKDIPAWGWPFLGALLMVFLGAFLICAPYFAAGMMTIIFAIGIICMGINFIVSIAMMEGILLKILMVILGLMVIAAGAACIYNPISGVLTVATIEALAMLFGGVACIVLSIELSKINSVRKKFEESMKNQ